MRVIIAGSRSITCYEKVKKVLDSINKYFQNNITEQNISEVICGGAKGVDSLGKRWAEENKIPVKMFPANWDKYGKSAGYIRNKEMVEYADEAIIFWDSISKGTKHTIDLADKKGIPSHVILQKDGEFLFVPE